MAKKSKTVKELTIDFEVLSERVKKLEVFAEISNGAVNQKKIEKIEDVLKAYDVQIENLNKLLEVQPQKLKKNEVENFICKVCDENFKCKKDLKDHNHKKHSKVLKCKRCEKSFDKSSDLEFIKYLSPIMTVSGPRN